jgi:hypothetical protein
MYSLFQFLGVHISETDSFIITMWVQARKLQEHKQFSEFKMGQTYTHVIYSDIPQLRME